MTITKGKEKTRQVPEEAREAIASGRALPGSSLRGLHHGVVPPGLQYQAREVWRQTDQGAVLRPRPAPCLRGASVPGYPGYPTATEKALGPPNIGVTETYLRSIGQEV